MRRQTDQPGQSTPGANRTSTPMVRSVERVAKIMEALFLAPEGTSLTDLSRELGLHKTTCLRLLRTLVALQVVAKDESRDVYSWNPMVWLNAATKLRRMWSAVDAIQSLLEKLAEEVGQSIGLTLPAIDGRRMILAAYALPDMPVRVHFGQRMAFPMHATAAGKIYLAQLPDSELREWLSGDLEKVTEDTITDPERLFGEIVKAREVGHAVTHGESLPGTCGLAIAVREPRGKAVGALAVGAPLGQVDEESIHRWLPALQECAGEVARRLYSIPHDNLQAKGAKPTN